MAKKPEPPKFIEIVNWKKAQPRMADGPNSWCKVYTSLLDHDGFEGLGDADRVLIVMLWAYATRSGRHVFPADPAWIHKRIPILNSKPNLGPLMDARDVFGNPSPFVRYCEPPAPQADQKAKAKKPVKKAAKKKVVKKTKKEKSRKEESREDEILADFEKKKEGERKERTKTRVSTEAEKTEKTEQQASVSTAAEKPEKPEKPVNPNDSEAGVVEAHIVPKPPQSVHSGPQAIGAIIGRRFADHWQDEDAEAFGWQIVEALGLPSDRHNLTARSEWGSFAKWWSDVKKSCPAIAIEQLRATAIRKAMFVNSPKCKSARNKSAVWFTIMKGEIGQGSGRRTRASP